jgi:hypothetical protein
MAKQHRKMWLMRNHVPVRLENISQQFLELLWENCNVSGFKEIRANFMVDWLYHELQLQIVYIVRHPFAVVSSILRRHNFWEFGWPETYEMFLAKTIYHQHYKNHQIADYIDVVKNAKTDIQKFTIMWAITHAIAIPELERLGLPLFYYEDFYTDPFPAVKNLLKYLGIEDASIHPAYIFTPSMTTLKTLHGLYESEQLIKNGASLFWENTLSSEQVDSIMKIIDHFGIELYNEKTYSQNNHSHVLCQSVADASYHQESRSS